MDWIFRIHLQLFWAVDVELRNIIKETIKECVHSMFL
jgi:hypothetical protein